MTTKFTENELIENKDLRNEMIVKIEVLEKVKNLLLLPNTELMTTQMVAEYYEVNAEVIKWHIKTSRGELESNGLKVIPYREIKEMVNGELDSLYKISKRGATIFTKRAVLNIGMLLRDSKVAKRIRTALLDQQEVMSDEQKVQGITDEQLLLLKIIQSDSEVDRAVSLSEYNNYKNRHIAELNVRIDEMKPKAESHDTFMDAKNYQSFNDAAKSIGIGRNTLMEYLRNKDILVKTGNKNIPYQQHINNGYFVVKQGTKTKGGKVISYATTYVTPKGIDSISKQLKKEGLI